MKPRLDYGSSGSGHRSVSGRLSQLKTSQVRELKEAFSLLDQDGDGTVNATDLSELLVSLGQDPDDKEVESMLKSMPQPLTFSAFLSAMSASLTQVSSREELFKAFAAFEDDSTDIPLDSLQDSLVEYGMTAADAKAAMAAYTVKDGFRGTRFNHKDFIDLMRPDEE